MQPGSLDSEAGIFASTFDNSGSRFLTCEADKSIKIYKEDDSAVRVSHCVLLNNNKALLPYSTCQMLHDELECSLALTHIVPIYIIK